MKVLLKLSALALAMSAACAVAAPNASSKDEAAFLTSLGAGVSHWSKVANGYFEGVDAAGVDVRVFVGVDGARLKLSEQQRELRGYWGRLDELAISGVKSKDKEAQSLLKEISVLEESIAGLLEVVEESAAARKVQQYVFPLSDLHCGFATLGSVIFSATSVASDTASIQVDWGAFGNSTPSPPPVVSPVYVNMQAQARVRYGSLSDLQGGNSTGAPFTVNSSLTVPAGQCNMFAYVSQKVRCTGGDNLLWYHIEYNQTCAGVLANTPPTES